MQLLPSLAVAELALLVMASTAAASSSASSSSSSSSSGALLSPWQASFVGRGHAMPPPQDDCAVCFYEKADFAGDRVCVGAPPAAVTDVIPIAAPATIGSIAFVGECALVANVRVLDPPYGQHVEAVVRNDRTPRVDVVQELFVQRDGTACFLAARDVDQYGRCYNGSVVEVAAVDQRAFYEVLLFKTNASAFDVVAFEHCDFNRKKSGLSKRFDQSSDDFQVEDDTADGVQSLAYKVSSVLFEVPAV